MTHEQLATMEAYLRGKLGERADLHGLTAEQLEICAGYVRAQTLRRQLAAELVNTDPSAPVPAGITVEQWAGIREQVVGELTAAIDAAVAVPGAFGEGARAALAVDFKE